MFGIIASPEFVGDIKAVLEDKHILFEKIGQFGPEVFQQHCTAAASVSIDFLIIDITCCSSDNDLVKGIRKYRVTRSSRVVVIAPGREPGDAAISALVADGVYDIVAPALPDEEDEETDPLDIQPHLKKQLSMNYHMGNAARWRSLDDDLISRASASSKVSKEKSGTTTQEQIVFRDRIVGTVVIGVAAAARRTGCTHSVIQMATFLAVEGHLVACIELMERHLQHPVFSSFKSNEPSGLHPGGFRNRGIDYFSYDQVGSISDIMHVGYDYILLDFGQLVCGDGTENKLSIYSEEFKRADLSFVTSGSALWDFDATMDFVQALQEWQINKRMSILINFADETLFKEISDSISGKEKQTLALQFAAAPYQPDPFKVTQACTGAYRSLLSGILPAQEKQNKGLLRSFVKRG